MRIKEIDVAKGIAIILVILGHSIGSVTNIFNKTILIFHMPLFFFLSGMSAKKQIDNSSIFWKKKACVYLIPQVTLGILSSIYEFLIEFLLMKSIELQEINIIENIFKYWFLLVLFAVVIIWDFIIVIFKDEKYAIVISLLVWIMGIFIDKEKSLFMYSNIIPHALGFYMLGYLAKKKDILNKKNIEYKGAYIFSIILIYIIAIVNQPVLMYENKYGMYLLFLIGSLLGIYLVINLSKVFKDNLLLEKWGKESIIIYVIHFFIVDLARGIVGRVLTDENIIIATVLLITIVLIIPIKYICNTYLYVFFGKLKSTDLINFKN